MAGGWSNSDRRRSLPGDWPVLRKRVLKRDGYQCQLRYNNVCTYDAEEVDHIDSNKNEDHSLSNLQAVCSACHAVKSSREGNEANRQRRLMEKRPREKHPGII